MTLYGGLENQGKMRKRRRNSPFRFFMLLTPVIFFLVSIYMIFSWVEKGSVATIEDHLKNHGWREAHKLLLDEISENRLARPRLLMYGTIIQYANEIEDLPDYESKLKAEDSTRIFWKESFLKRFELFPDKPGILELVIEYLNSFPNDAAPPHPLAGVFSSSDFTEVPEGYEIFFTAKSTQTLISGNSMYRIYLRAEESANSTSLGQLEIGEKVITGKTGRADTINDVNGHWVRILSEKGKTGWVFDGLLQPSR